MLKFSNSALKSVLIIINKTQFNRKDYYLPVACEYFIYFVLNWGGCEGDILRTKPLSSPLTECIGHYVLRIASYLAIITLRKMIMILMKH